MKHRFVFWLSAASLLLQLDASARAHDPGLSSVTLIRSGDVVEYRVLVNDADLPARRRAAAVSCDGQGVLSVWLDRARVQLAPVCRAYDAHRTAFEGRFALHGGLETLTLQLPLLAELPRGHRSFARVVDAQGRMTGQALLADEGATLHAQVASARVPDFFVLGILHIVTGLDHLLFLSLLLLNIRAWGDMLRVVSCFTLAHSVTLALATFGWIALPSRLVESSIAASIVWVAARNCLAKIAQRERLATTFGFGLIHGLGFASALRELGVTGATSAALLPLAQFNLGVEVGQIAFGALVMACWLQLRDLPRSAVTARTLSGIAAALGLFWLMQRVVGL